MTHWNICTVSDSTGETGEAISRAWVSQFSELDAEILRYSHVDSRDRLDEILPLMEDHCIVVNSIVIPDLAGYIKEACAERKIPLIDLFDAPLAIIGKATGLEPARLPALSREMDPDYFNKIASIEFAVKYDDGKDPRGMLKADIVLVGVSRTSKTPLSMFLANKGYNIANLPLVPEAVLPEEIYRVDPLRLVGLMIRPESLHRIRSDRMKALGLSGASIYADDGRINHELAYAKEVFDRLGCRVMDVSDQTIEQSAARILEEVGKSLGSQIRRYQKA